MNLDIGEKLLGLRKDNDLSQRELARLSGVTNSTISRLESNVVSPDIATLKCLSRAFEMDDLSFFSELGIFSIRNEIVKINSRIEECSEEEQQDICRELTSRFDEIMQEKEIEGPRVN